jgi:ABC-type bacteriocin/lantibiotic exporter with double-glycine peptidase domain
MSHAVTITRTTTTHSSTTSAIIINSGYMKTIPGILKLLELIVGGLCVFFLTWNFWSTYTRNTELFFLCMAVAFFIGTFCLLVSCLVSLSTGGIISKTIYELVYHSIAFILYLVASILLMMKATDYRLSSSHPFMIAAILGLINSVLYLVSTFYAQRSYRGI